jgi:hypothetical protein
VLRWVREQGYPWDEWTCSKAARLGHLKLLKWAREQGCPWDEWTCEAAAEGGHLEVLRWAMTHGCLGTNGLARQPRREGIWRC